LESVTAALTPQVAGRQTAQFPLDALHQFAAGRFRAGAPSVQPFRDVAGLLRAQRMVSVA
jgi:hypothetical protein